MEILFLIVIWLVVGFLLGYVVGYQRGTDWGITQASNVTSQTLKKTGHTKQYVEELLVDIGFPRNRAMWLANNMDTKTNAELWEQIQREGQKYVNNEPEK